LRAHPGGAAAGGLRLRQRPGGRPADAPGRAEFADPALLPGAVRRLARAEQPPRAHAALLRRAARAAGLRSGPRRRGARAGRRAAGAAARSVRPAAGGVRRRARAARRSAPSAFTRRRLRRRARRPASLLGWRKGRRRGLKLPGPDRPLWVRLPPRAPCARRAPRAARRATPVSATRLRRGRLCRGHAFARERARPTGPPPGPGGETRYTQEP